MTVPRSSAAIRASRSRRSRPLRGRKPSNDQRGPANAGAHDGGQHRRRTRNRHDRPALGSPGGDEFRARIADPGRSRVGHQGEIGAAPQVVEERGRLARGRSGRDSSSSSVERRVDRAAGGYGGCPRRRSAGRCAGPPAPEGSRRPGCRSAWPRRTACRWRHAHSPGCVSAALARPAWGSSRVGVTRGASPAGGAGRGSRRPSCAGRAWRWAAPGA